MSSRSRIFAVLLVICNITFGNGGPPQKITMGFLVPRDGFSYVVSLEKDGKHYCGGAIISEEHILTAAHCVEGSMFHPYSNIAVVTGTKNLYFGGERHTISKATVHPFFVMSGKRSYPNDIAVLKLSEPITFNENQNKILLPNSDIKDGSKGEVAGWGLQANVFSAPAFLLFRIPVEILEPNKCRNYLENQLYYEQLCGVYFGRQGTCGGDSGGPLAVDGKIVGVVSWGNKVCGGGHPDIYTNVYAYKEFIQQQMT